MFFHFVPRSNFIAAALAGLLTLLSAPASSFACPTVGNLIDMNCDQQHRIAITGDSIVYGRGDEENDGHGGYVLRLRERFRRSKVLNLGVPGITSLALYQSFKELLSKPKDGTTKIRLNDADIIVIDVGRNDFFGNELPGITVRNIYRLVKLLRHYVLTETGSEPVIGIATLLPTRRGYQRGFIDEVNRLLLQSRSSLLPVALRFDSISVDDISFDGLHPISEGYDVMAQIAIDFVRTIAQDEGAARRIDKDDDGIYDMFEKKRFNTSPKTADSDGDGLLDGFEVFTEKTDPTLADTDGDGVSDSAEVSANTDPLDAASFPTPVTPELG